MMAPKKKQAATPESQSQETERCFWTPADERHLITYIENNRAKGSDGLNFDKAFWVQAAANMLQSTTCGAVKTGDACSSKQEVWENAIPHMELA
jgi:hypothetical protein